MTAGAAIVERWKTPEDLRRWLEKRFERFVAADLREPGMPIDTFQITAPGLTAGIIAEQFAVVRSWAGAWQEAAAAEPDLVLAFAEWQTRNFGRVRIPKTAYANSIDGAARLVRRTRELASARQRYAALMATDSRLEALASHWPRITCMSQGDFTILCRFVKEATALDLTRLRLREVPCPGMHTKFLEQNRTVLKPILAALNVPLDPKALTWAGKLGFFEDDTRMFELRDLDGSVLPYPHFALPAGQLTGECPARAAGAGTPQGVVIVENQATFQALPRMPGIVAIFGRGFTVRILVSARWLAFQPVLYLGDLDHAGFQMVAGLRRDGLAHLQTALMDVRTAKVNKSYWVNDTSAPGTNRAYEGLIDRERAAQQLMAAGPWRLEQERIPFDMLVDNLERWYSSRHQASCGALVSGSR
ncbi:Wadjet anti-phage system protein JetD domain-containing protein [Pelagibius sp.]|uniref:Wadjet anti-phage system protein JetD domain-containing protein n=1 Tax=Pelagibius sp. TaxID=1931238 RepID=UPI003B50D957